MGSLNVAHATSPRAASSCRKPLAPGRAGSPRSAAERQASLTQFPTWPKHAKAAFHPSAVSLACIARSSGGRRHLGESQSYPRRVSGEAPMSVPGTQRRFGLWNWASSAPPVARRTCRRELRIAGQLCSKPSGMGAVGRRSSVGPGAVPCGSHKTLILSDL